MINRTRLLSLIAPVVLAAGLLALLVVGLAGRPAEAQVGPPQGKLTPTPVAPDDPDTELAPGWRRDVDRAPGPPAAKPVTIAMCNQNVYCSTLSDPGATRSLCILITFPNLAWRACVEKKPRTGVWLGPVDVRQSTTPWQRILYEGGPQEIFVPYHDRTIETPDVGAQTLYDTKNTTTAFIAAVAAGDGGPAALAHAFPGDLTTRLISEVRDRGVAHLCKDSGTGVSYVRRGREVAVWGVLDTGNYDYITEFTFGDDGGLRFRLGATGYNAPAGPDKTHAHSILWYVDPDILGPFGDTAYHQRHVEPTPLLPLVATDSSTAIATETALPFTAGEWTTLAVRNFGVNIHGHQRGFEIEVPRLGLGRHFGTFESFSHLEYWVTRWQSAVPWQVAWNYPDGYLPPLLNAQSVAATDLAVWLMTAAHHEPSDEDRAIGDTGTAHSGLTNIHWTGFDLRPHDFFPSNPLGGSVASCF